MSNTAYMSVVASTPPRSYLVLTRTNYRAVVTVAVSASTLSTTQPGAEHESMLSPPHRLLLGQARPYRTHHHPS